jgi:hypothetical protein
LLYDQMRRGHLSYLKVGRRRLITRQHLEQFLAIIAGAEPPSAHGTPAGLQAAGDAPRPSLRGRDRAEVTATD